MPRPRARAIWEFGDQWIAKEPGRKNIYKYWHDPETGRTCRESLGTTDPEQAKALLAESVVRGTKQAMPDYVASIMETYFLKRTDRKASKQQSRSAAVSLLRCWGDLVKASELDDAKQKSYAEWCIEQGFRLSYVARNLGVLSAALRFAGIPSSILTNPNSMRDRWHLVDKPPRRRFIPSDLELARLLSAEIPEKLFRFIIIQMATGGRPQTALDLQPEMRERDASLITLLKPDTRQNKKYRPTIREPAVLRGWLDRWEAEGLEVGLNSEPRYCGYSTIEGVKTALQAWRVKKAVNLPGLSTYSFRHKVATALRQRKVPEDEISSFLGHKRPNLRVTAGYGEWDPRYLAQAAQAIDAWFTALQPHCSRCLFSHGFLTPMNPGGEHQA